MRAVCARGNGEAGLLGKDRGAFLTETGVGWGAGLDILSIGHGAAGCGEAALAHRLHYPGFIQGIETFTALHACSDLKAEDLEDKGNSRLKKAIDEAALLFPLARGLCVINEESVSQIGTDVYGIVQAKFREKHRPIITLSYGWAPQLATKLRKGSHLDRERQHGSYDVAIIFKQQAPGLVWIASKLLKDMGLNPIHVTSGNSLDDLGRIRNCRLVIDFAPSLDTPYNFRPGSIPQTIRDHLNIPLVWVCFLGPSLTDASLRKIAGHFDSTIRQKTEDVIAANRIKVDTTVARYRPRLENKLFVSFGVSTKLMLEGHLEPFHLLGMRIGNEHGWPGSHGIPRRPRLVWRGREEKSLASYLTEARPDIAFLNYSNAAEWTKRGLAALPDSPLFDQAHDWFWAYDGFVSLAAALDRYINAPWRKLMKPPWPQNSG